MSSQKMVQVTSQLSILVASQDKSSNPRWVSPCSYAALIAQESLDEADKIMGVSTKYSVPQCTLETEK